MTMERIDCLMRFRRCKSEKTLETVYERLLEKTTTAAARANVILAYCQREREIEQGRLLNR